MEKEFVPYEQALALKELEFNRRTFAEYSTIINNKWVLTFDLSEEGQYPEGSSACIAPTFSQAFRWFREKYGIIAFPVFIRRIGYRFEISIDEGDSSCSTKVYNSPEESELECLKKLIEIVKQK